MRRIVVYTESDIDLKGDTRIAEGDRLTLRYGAA